MLEILGAFVIVAGGMGAIIKLLSPFKKQNARIADLEKYKDKAKDLFEKDNQRIQREEEATSILLTSLFALINHALTGNSQESLKAAREKLQDYLAKR